MNVRFALIVMEFQGLRDYVALLEHNLPVIVHRESQFKAGLADLGVDEGAIDGLYELQSGAATRLIAGSAIVALWAAYEAAVNFSAGYLQQQREVALPLRSLRGSFLDRARMYFDDVLKFDLHPVEDANWDRLRVLAEVRHSFAHDNGKDPGPKTARGKMLRAWASTTTELRVAEGYVVPSLAFVRESAEYLSSLVAELIMRVRG